MAVNAAQKVLFGNVRNTNPYVTAPVQQSFVKNTFGQYAPNPNCPAAKDMANVGILGDPVKANHLDILC